MVGIFITGPLGFVVGGVVGFLYWAIPGRKGSSKGENENAM
jgi:hypothetical protein